MVHELQMPPCCQAATWICGSSQETHQRAVSFTPHRLVLGPGDPVVIVLILVDVTSKPQLKDGRHVRRNLALSAETRFSRAWVWPAVSRPLLGGQVLQRDGFCLDEQRGGHETTA